LGTGGLSDRALRWSFVFYLLILAVIAALRSGRSPSAMRAEPATAHWAALVASEVDAGSHSNQVYADCVDLSAVENASK
jgi:hypothetical protein